MLRSLLFYPDPLLRQKSQPVRDFSLELQDLANDMRKIMLNNSGMGLAAVQVGDLRRLIIVEYPGGDGENDPAIPFTILINPKITKANTQTKTVKEGCLSIPAVEIPVSRATEITVSAQNVSGEPIQIRAKGTLARIIQHEIDHLNGVLILDYAKDINKADATVKTMVWGSTEFTTQFINTILTNPLITLTHLVTEPPKPSGRGRQVQPTIVHTYAKMLDLPCLEPEQLSDARFLSYFQAQTPDLILVAAYGKLLPPELLAIPKFGCINIHPSLLPKYRGATPIQAAILAGDKTTGVSVIKMSPSFDTGEILAISEVELEPSDTYGTLQPILAELGGQIINEILPEYLAGKLNPVTQDEAFASATKKIKTEDRWLNPADPPELNERKVRAYAPSPGAFTVINGATMKILAAHLENGQLIFDIVQPAGKKPMAWTDFQRGYKKPITFDSTYVKHG